MYYAGMMLKFILPLHYTSQKILHYIQVILISGTTQALNNHTN